MILVISDDNKQDDDLVSNFPNADNSGFANDHYKKHTINARRNKIDNNFRIELGINDPPTIKTKGCFTKDYNKKNNKYSGKDDVAPKKKKKKKEKKKKEKDEEEEKAEELKKKGQKKKKKKIKKTKKDKAGKSENTDDEQTDEDGDDSMKRTLSHKSNMSVDNDDNDDEEEEEKKIDEDDDERYSIQFLQTLTARRLRYGEFDEIENYSSNFDGNKKWQVQLGNYQNYDSLEHVWRQLHHTNKKRTRSNAIFYYKKKNYKS